MLKIKSFIAAFSFFILFFSACAPVQYQTISSVPQLNVGVSGIHNKTIKLDIIFSLEAVNISEQDLLEKMITEDAAKIFAQSDYQLVGRNNANSTYRFDVNIEPPRYSEEYQPPVYVARVCDEGGCYGGHSTGGGYVTVTRYYYNFKVIDIAENSAIWEADAHSYGGVLLGRSQVALKVVRGAIKKFLVDIKKANAVSGRPIRRIGDVPHRSRDNSHYAGKFSVNDSGDWFQEMTARIDKIDGNKNVGNIPHFDLSKEMVDKNIIHKQAVKAEQFEIYNAKGVQEIAKGNYDQALVFLNQSITLKSDYAFAYYNRAVVYRRQNNYEQAVSDFTKAIELKDNEASFYFSRGEAYEKQWKRSFALKDYNKTIELDPNNADAYAGRGYISYGINRDEKAAIADYNKALTLDAKNPTAYNGLIEVYYRDKKYGKAWSYVRKAEKLGIAIDSFLRAGLVVSSGREE